MAFLRQKSSSVTPDYTGLQLQTSVSTLPIPIVWGQTKVSANVLWYSNFQTQAQSSGKGGLFSSPTSGYAYSADLIMGLCEGYIGSIGQIWKDQSVYSLSGLGLTLFNGTTPQSVWGYIETADPAEALAYQGTAYVCAASYALGDNASISNHNFEVLGLWHGYGVNGIDADPAQVINDFLTSPQFGAGFNPASIAASTLFGSSGDASLQTYCKALGIAFSPALTDQEQASSILTRWLQLLNCAAVWSGGELKFIPYADAAIPAGNTLSTTAAVLVPTPALGGYPSIVVCGASQFVADGGVAYALRSQALSFIGSGQPTQAGTYGISPAGTYLFAAGDEGQAVQITYSYATTTAFNPNLTPLYSLTDLDFVDEKGNKDPVQVSRVDPFSLPTIQRIECLSRSNQYDMVPVEARDQSQIELYGPRVGSTIQAHEICDEINIGPIVAQTILQRGLYVRAHFAFKLSWEYCLLDPMDVVEISDANLGLNAYPVRITALEEDDQGLITVTAEELTVGVSTPALYQNATASGGASIPNRGAAADPVNAPLIFEPLAAFTDGTPQLWIGASGGANGVADPNWGGANVFVSLDDATFTQIATITGPLRQGVLTANLPLGKNWDATHTLAVTLAESGGALGGASQAAAQQGATRSLVDGEMIAYESAALTGAHAYNLTGLQRGLYGTAPAAHSAGAQFARLDGAVVAYDLPSNFIGQTLYLKFQSFNVFGHGAQSLADCAARSTRLPRSSPPACRSISARSPPLPFFPTISARSDRAPSSGFSI